MSTNNVKVYLETKQQIEERLKLNKTDFAGGLMVMIRCPDYLDASKILFSNN